MEEKKACDDIFEGLADVLINTGEVVTIRRVRVHKEESEDK